MKFKNLILILVIFFQYKFIAQENKIEKEISKLFFNLNLNQKPIDITLDSGFNFEYSRTGVYECYYHSYSTIFLKHQIIKGKINERIFSIEYNSDEEKKGVYSLNLEFVFESKSELIENYEILTNQFEKYSSKTIIESIQNENYNTKSEITSYQKNKNSEIPAIEFFFEIEEGNSFSLIVTYKNNWKTKVE